MEAKAAGEALTVKKVPHRPGTAPALGLRAGNDVLFILSQTNNGRNTMRRLSCLTIAALMFVTLSAANPGKAVADGPPAVSYSPVVLFPPLPGDLKGVSALRRTDDGVSMVLMAGDLPPGAYTLWTRIDNPGESPISGFLAGHVVGDDGVLNFGAHVSAGEFLSGNPHIPAGALLDPRNATIFLVVRYHGPAVPGRIYEQTHNFEPDPAAFNALLSIHTP